MKTYTNLIEDLLEVMTSTGGGVAGMHQSILPLAGDPEVAGRKADRLAIKPRRKKTYEKFAGCPVFTLNGEEYQKCMNGRNKYERWNRKLNMEDMNNQEMKTYAHRNPGKGIVIKDSTTGIMSYLLSPNK